MADMRCQKCRSPLRVDSSLEDLNPASFDLIVGSTGISLQQSSKALINARPNYPHERKETYDHAAKHAQAPIFKRSIPAPRLSSRPSSLHPNTSPTRGGNPAMSFVMLTESQVVPHPKSKVADGSRQSPGRRLREAAENNPEQEEKNPLSHQMDMTTRLFEILSSRSDVDHPICAECTELLVEGLQKRLGNATRERDAYVEFLKKMNAEVPTEAERQAAEQDLESSKREEEAAFAELQTLEQEKADVDEEIAALEEEARLLDIEEEKFWRERNAFALILSEFQNERDGINLQFDHDSRQLERLQRTNVYNDTFCIGHDGYFGTINGLRLGRLANQPVDWPEINAAWGQTLLLLATVAEKLGFTFEGYRLKPMGSTSRIEKWEYPQSGSTTITAQTLQPKVTALDLFSSGNMPLGFLHRRFDNAMVAFLECLRQLGHFVEHEPTPVGGAAGGFQPGLKLPYEIKKDKIGDATIKLGYLQDESWTRACKYTLTCCKFLLAHASNIGGSGRRAAGQ